MHDVLLTLKVLGKNPSFITPYGNYVFVRILEISEETLGGIVLPSQVVERDRQMLARVIKTGPGARSNSTGEVLPCISNEGDLVIVQKHAPMEVKLGGEKVYVVFEGDIVGKVTPEDEGKLNQMVADLKATIEAEQAERQTEAGAAQSNVVEDTETATVTERPSGLLLVTSKGGA